ncbi:MAG: hypothetical protein ACAI34_22655 [Verrucomicrobium sp.]
MSIPTIHKIKEGDWIEFGGNYFRMWEPSIEVVTDGSKADHPLGRRLSVQGEDAALMEMRGADADQTASLELSDFLAFSSDGQQPGHN